MKGWTDPNVMTNECWNQSFDVENVDIRSFFISLEAYYNEYDLGSFSYYLYQWNHFADQNTFSNELLVSGSTNCLFPTLRLSFMVGIYE